jgi:hypothetical protein
MENYHNKWNNSNSYCINNKYNEPFHIVKISLNTNVRNAIDFVMDLFQNKNAMTVYICGLSLAISKVILVAEIVKTKIIGLHQLNNIDCVISNSKSSYGYGSEDKRTPKLDIILTKFEPDHKGMGYQYPMDIKDIKVLHKIRKKKNFPSSRLIRKKVLHCKLSKDRKKRRLSYLSQKFKTKN